MVKEDDPREFEKWLLITGACLSSGIQREKIFKELDPSDCPYPQVANILAALKDGDAAKIQHESRAFYFLDGVDTGDGILKGIVERVKQTAAKRKRIREAERALKEARE